MAQLRAANGAAIRAIREALGKRQGAMAAEVGITAGALANIEASRRQPSPATTRRIATVLAVPLAAITYPVVEPWQPRLTDDENEPVPAGQAAH